MEKLLNKIKLIIAGYINKKNEEHDDYMNGKIALAKEISDAIDFVNKKNLEVDKLDVGDIVFRETIESIPAQMGYDRKAYLRLHSQSSDMHFYDLPFILNKDNEDNMHGETFEVIVRKVEANKKNPARKKADAADAQKLVFKVRRNARNIELVQEFVPADFN